MQPPYQVPPTVPLQQPPKQNSTLKIVLIVAGVVVAAMCLCIGVIGVLTLLGQRVDSTATKVFTASDNNSQISAPTSWRVIDDLNEKAEIKIGNKVIDRYVLVLTETKDSVGVADVAEFTELSVDNFTSSIDNPTVSGPNTLTINGRQAVQYEVHGVTDDLEVVYLVTGVDGKEHFHQVIGLCGEEDFAKAREPLQTVIMSFEET